jgi:hypothetical protein
MPACQCRLDEGSKNPAARAPRGFTLGGLLGKSCHAAKGAEDRPDLKHGTYHVYWYWNCRCDPYKAANARKSADLRAKKLARRFDLPNKSSGGETRTPNQPVNSRLLCRLSYPRLSIPWVW